MPSNEADGIEFTLLGSYLPRDTQKLLERLDRKGIAFRTRPTMPFPQPGPSTTLVISVDPARSNEANEILRDLVWRQSSVLRFMFFSWPSTTPTT